MTPVRFHLTADSKDDIVLPGWFRIAFLAPVGIMLGALFAGWLYPADWLDTLAQLSLLIALSQPVAVVIAHEVWSLFRAYRKKPKEEKIPAQLKLLAFDILADVKRMPGQLLASIGRLPAKALKALSRLADAIETGFKWALGAVGFLILSLVLLSLLAVLVYCVGSLSVHALLVIIVLYLVFRP